MTTWMNSANTWGASTSMSPASSNSSSLDRAAACRGWPQDLNLHEEIRVQASALIQHFLKQVVVGSQRSQHFP